MSTPASDSPLEELRRATAELRAVVTQVEAALPAVVKSKGYAGMAKDLAAAEAAVARLRATIGLLAWISHHPASARPPDLS